MCMYQNRLNKLSEHTCSNKRTTLSYRNENTIILEIEYLYLTCKLELNNIMNNTNEVIPLCSNIF